MFFQSTIIAALVALAAATPLAIRTGSGCNSGTVQCCNELKDSSEFKKDVIASLLSLDIGEITGQVGIQCSPVLSLVGGTSCSTQTVCCEGNKFNGLVNVGCTPINLAL